MLHEKTVKILLLESFLGGSHGSVARYFAEHSRNDVEIVGLPPRFWKWRMRGAALFFAQKVRDIGRYDLILATDMMDLTDFKALAGSACPPVALYFHENQLSYPLAPGETRDFHLGFTNVISAFAADAVLFNSAFHRDDFLNAAGKLIRKMPDARPVWMMDAIAAKSQVLYPGCPVPAQPQGMDRPTGEPPLVVWNHRWEYDKDPDTFFRVMDGIARRNIPFRLAVLGERYGKAPKVFDTVETRFEGVLEAFGFEEDPERYRDILSRGTCVVSTAVQENFGIAVVEAVALGCFPLLPRRLSYPELIPEKFHARALYRDEADLEEKLATLLCRPKSIEKDRRLLSAHARGFSWEHMTEKWDRMLETLL